jgi:hypothetical protein
MRGAAATRAIVVAVAGDEQDDEGTSQYVRRSHI